jgi:hypothetical protein
MITRPTTKNDAFLLFDIEQRARAMRARTLQAAAGRARAWIAARIAGSRRPLGSAARA